MKQQIKIVCLYILKYTGMFMLWRRFARNGLQILCYHGIAFKDEHHFKPGLFMRADTFENRISLIRHLGCEVLPLDKAVELLRQDALPRNAVTITIDDGWLGTLRYAVPTLRAAGMPATIYVTTYYVVHEEPVFNIAVRYMFWKSTAMILDLAKLGIEDAGMVNLVDPVEAEKSASSIIHFGRKCHDANGRARLLQALGEQLGVPIDDPGDHSMFRLMSTKEVAQAAEAGIDIQLHTHRHQTCKDDRIALQREIEDNRTVLSDLARGELKHFCYPSGNFSEQQFDWLAGNGVVSATTCNPGINYAGANCYALNRFLDSEDMSPIEFEAALIGLGQLWR